MTDQTEARRAALREATHLMPRYFGVWSSTGVHIGVWDDGATAVKVLGEYPGGVLRDLIDVDAILALIDAEATVQHKAVQAAAKVILEANAHTDTHVTYAAAREYPQMGFINAGAVIGAALRALAKGVTDQPRPDFVTSRITRTTNPTKGDYHD